MNQRLLSYRDEEFRLDIISALDSRLKSKNDQTVALAISLLDTMEKNCFGPFHKLICQKDFLNNLFRIATKEQVRSSFFIYDQSPENSEAAADLIQCLALSFSSVGKEYRLFETLYRSLRNRGVEFKKEEEADVFTPNLSEEVVQNVPSGMHVRKI